MDAHRLTISQSWPKLPPVSYNTYIRNKTNRRLDAHVDRHDMPVLLSSSVAAVGPLHWQLWTEHSPAEAAYLLSVPDQAALPCRQTADLRCPQETVMASVKRHPRQSPCSYSYISK